MNELDASSEALGQSGEEDPFLDDLFERALGTFEEGSEPAIDEWLVGRQELRTRAAELVELAREVAVHAPRRASPCPTVAGYVLERELGSGAMGTVYLARQLALGGRAVALKVLPPSLGLSARAKTRFLNEARALGRLSHPAVVGVHDVVDAEGIVAFAMDWIEGGPLATVLSAWRHAPELDELTVAAELTGVERRHFGNSAVLWLVREFAALAHALQEVHQHGFLHRDLKPANILVGRDGKLLLSDFGLVRDPEAELHTRTGQYVGTLSYSAPEQLRGEHAAVDARSDVFALGVTLYEALTLCLPYEGRSATQLLARTETGAFAVPRRHGKRLPRDLGTIVGKAIDPEPARRYPSAADLAEDLERLLSFQPIRARPAGLGSRILRLARRNRQAVVLAGIVSAVMLVLAVQGSRWWLDRRLARERASTALQEARIALLDPKVTGVLFAAALQPGHKDTSRDSLVPLTECAQAALRSYDEALAFDPPEDLFEDVELERATVAAALEIERKGHPTLPESFRRSLPITAEIIARWAQGERVLEFGADRVVAREDLRHLGLFLLLSQEPRAALAVWEEVADSFPVDPMADALLGEYLRVVGEPERAFELLRSACNHFGPIGFLRARLADVALITGRVNTARRLLEDIESLPNPDPYETHLRVRADLHGVLGEDREARELYEALLPRRVASSLFLHYSHYLELQGERAHALWSVDALNVNQPEVDQYEEELLRIGEQWWRESPEPSWKKLRRALDDPAFPPGPLATFLSRYRVAAEKHAATPEVPVIRTPFSRALTEHLAGAPAPAHGLRLRDIAGVEEIQRIDRRLWDDLPIGLRSLHAAVLCSPWAEDIGPICRWVEQCWKAQLVSQTPVGPAGDERNPWPSLHGDPENRRRAHGLNQIAGGSLWSHPCFGPPVVAEGLVVFRNDEAEPRSLVALDLETGSEAWAAETGPTEQMEGLAAVGNRLFIPLGGRRSRRASPALTQRVECRSLESGLLLWTWNSGFEGGAYPLQEFLDLESKASCILVTHYEIRPGPSRNGWSCARHLSILDANGANSQQAWLCEDVRSWTRSSNSSPVILSQRSPALEIWNHEIDQASTDQRSAGLFGVQVHLGERRIERVCDFEFPQEPVALAPQSVSYRGYSPAPVVDGMRRRLYQVDRAGWLHGFDLATRKPLWPRVRVSTTFSNPSFTVLDDGAVVILDPTVAQVTFVDPTSVAFRLVPLPAPPTLNGYLVGDESSLWLAGQDGGIHRLDARTGSTTENLSVPGALELVWAGDALLVRTERELLVFQ